MGMRRWLARLLIMVGRWVWNLADAIPPYKVTEGLLTNKETRITGRFLITVNSANVEVDSVTFNALVVGESVRVRYTRGHRAINIDRLLPERGPG